jgi:uncharacterized membrane protein
MSPVTLYSFLFSLVGVLFIGISVPLIQKRVPPNRYYGFRTPKTLSDPDLWYKANHVSGIDLFIAGALITVSSLTMMLLAQRWQPEQVAMTLLVVMVFSLVGVAWHSFMVLKRL